MIVLIIVFILLFAFSCAALAITDEYEYRLLSNGWNNLDNETKAKWEKFGNCCGFDNKTRSESHPCHGQTKSEVNFMSYRVFAPHLFRVFAPYLLPLIFSRIGRVRCEG